MAILLASFPTAATLSPPPSASSLHTSLLLLGVPTPCFRIPLPPKQAESFTSRALFTDHDPPSTCDLLTSGYFLSACSSLYKGLSCAAFRRLSPSSLRCRRNKLKPSFLHCLSHMHLGSCHPDESLTPLRTKLNSSLSSSMSTSMPFCWHDSYSCVSADSSVLLPSSSSANRLHCSWSFGSQAKPSDLHRLQTCPST